MSDTPHGPRTTSSGVLFWSTVAIAIVLVGWALKATSVIVIPVLVSFFLAIVLAPFDYGIRSRLPDSLKWLGHVASMLVILVILAIFAAGIGLTARQVVQRFPDQIGGQSALFGGEREQPDPSEREPIRSLREQELVGPPSQRTEAEGPGGGQRDGQAQDSAQAQRGGSTEQPQARSEDGFLDSLRGYRDNVLDYLRQRGAGMAATVLSRTATFLSSLGLVLFLTLFLLIEMPNWQRKIEQVLERRRELNWFRALEDTAVNLRWFLVVKTLLGLLTGALYAGWLWVMGVDLVLTWGVVTFLLSYIPVLGSLLAGFLAGGYAFFQLDFGQWIVLALGLLAIEQVMGNFIEPRFLGRQLALSSFMVLVFLLIWGWLWGAAGALLATPILIFLVSIAAHFDRLRPLAILASEDGEKSIERMQKRQD